MLPGHEAFEDVRIARAMNACSPDPRDLPIIGHRLPGGFMSVHYPGQPCERCDEASAKRAAARPRRARLLRSRRAARSLAAASALAAAVTALTVLGAGAGSASAATVRGGLAQMPRAAYIDSELNGVGVAPGGSAFAVGQFLAGTVEGGLAEQGPGWQLKPTPQVGGSAANDVLNGVTVLSPTNAWAVGFSSPWPAYDTLIEHWNGSSWQQVASPNPAGPLGMNMLGDVAAYSASDIWAVGSYLTGVNTNNPLIEHWDGTSWTQVPCPEPKNAAGAVINGIAVRSPSDAWAVGYYDDGTANQSLTEHWNGTAWHVVPSPDPAGQANWASLNGVTMLSHTNVWAAGEYQTQGVFHTFVAHWNGATWTQVASANPGGLGNNAFLRSIAAASSKQIFAVGSYNNTTADQTLIEEWNGSSWHQVPSPNPGTGPLNNELFSVAANSASNAWAVGWYSVGPVNQTLIEHWNDTTWTQVYSPNG